MKHLLRASLVMGVVFAALTTFHGNTRSAGVIQEQTTAQPSGGEWYFNITDPGRAVRMAIPDFEIGTADATDASHTISSVVWNDMEFASIYRLVPKRNYSIAQTSADPRKIDFYQWESVGADILIRGVTEIQRDTLITEVRIYAILAQEMVFGKRYEGPVSAARRMAHRIADDILIQAGNYKGISQTKLAFTSDRAASEAKRSTSWTTTASARSRSPRTAR